MESKTIAVDVDGVLANFNLGYGTIFDKNFNLNVAQHAPNPPVWDWPEHFGATDDQVAMVWGLIHKSPHFWEFLEPLATAESDLYALDYLRSKGHEIYFLTNRVGEDCKGQTWRWLKKQGYSDPTILITSDVKYAKADICRGLGVDMIIDDRPSNLLNLPRRTAGYMKRYAYNEFEPIPQVAYVDKITEALLEEGLVDERFTR